MIDMSPISTDRDDKLGANMVSRANGASFCQVARINPVVKSWP